MDKNRDKTVYCCASVILKMHGDGTPDWNELHAYLVSGTGRQAWRFLHDPKRVCAVTYLDNPLMVACLIMSSEALHLLKWKDLASEEVRIIADRSFNGADAMLLNQVSAECFSCMFEDVCSH